MKLKEVLLILFRIIILETKVFCLKIEKLLIEKISIIKKKFFSYLEKKERFYENNKKNT